ncbi:hypothetical protein [uncultured Intestinimonas sp.]|uniref:hypothetical protein n=1 Tax=uncultured Intestinimonas sp. TaxID=1689265 RepID=UPI0029428397|nr:hypothetical protein [uncultured Intestinimonas sp.]
MGKYIELEDLIKRICEEKCKSEYSQCPKRRDGKKFIFCVCDFIKLQPAADVAPVRHGRWEQGDMYDYGDVCSLCDWDSEREPCNLPYCPNCGAKMDGGE